MHAIAAAISDGRRIAYIQNCICAIAFVACVAPIAHAAGNDDFSITNEVYDIEPDLGNYTPEMRAKAVRELKKIERRSRRLGINLNRGKMESMKGERIFRVLSSFDRFVGVLEELPDGFTKASNVGSVWFSDEIVDMDGNRAGGVASGEGIELPLAFDTGTIYHEMFHKFEGAISERDKIEWEECNPKEFIYTGSKWASFTSFRDKRARESHQKRLAAGKVKSAAEEREKAMSKKDRARIEANKTNEVVQAAFINDYAQTTPQEDRAEVFRCMVTEGPQFFWRAAKSPHMYKKMEWMLRVTGKKKILGTDFWEEHSEMSHNLSGKTGSDDFGQYVERSTPEAKGYSSQKFKLIGKAIERYKIATGALVISIGGHTVYEYGDVSRLADISLCWPSIMSIAYGKYVHSGLINLDETIAKIGVNDVGGLLSREKDTAVRHLLSSSSCCYHQASVDLPGKRENRERGSFLPGHEFLPNNWDYAVAATVFEHMTGKSVPEAFGSDIAEKIGLKDWDERLQVKKGDREKSVHLVYEMHMSARDMCRIGELMLKRGKWHGMQILPEKWVEESTKSVMNISGGGGYGYGWWIENEDQEPRVFKGAYSARGLRGERITVLPQINMVIAHLPEFDSKKSVKGNIYRKLLILAVGAKD